ncbi:unnamed protein product [Urochloa humidicola]
MAAAAAIFGNLLLLVRDEARVALPMHRGRIPLRCRLLRHSAMFILLGASTLFHAVADPKPEASLVVAAAGFLLWVAGAALLLLAVMADRFPAASRLAARLVEALIAAFFF